MTIRTCTGFIYLLIAAGLHAQLLPSNVKSSNPKVVGASAADVLSPELREATVATGAMPLENPSGIFKFYGYNDNGSFTPTKAGSKAEANKTEPDKNTYLVLANQIGADANYNYGTHFLFQGHETGVTGYITRINLDADGPHRVTLMASTDVKGAPLPLIDGSTWYPFSQRLLFTSENGANGGVWQATLDVPSKVEDISGVTGRGGYEGIQSDAQGRLIIVEDVGGSTGTVNTAARRPNSFIYRFVPYDNTDLLKGGGKLQVLQVRSRAHTGPISYNFFPDADSAILSQDELDLHTYNLVFSTQWVTIHDTKVDGTAPFNANAMAKAADGTPFKRPENGQFRPGTNFTWFIFDETGDTNLNTQAGVNYGGFGSLFRLIMGSGDTGTLQLLYRGDSVHAGFDNVAFWDTDHVVFVEDAGDTLHTQRNALDSAWMFDVRADYSSSSVQPVRVLAQGRDASAALDATLGTVSGFSDTFPNEGDNEITGWHHSDGDPTTDGLLGAKIPTPFQNGWRLFYTQQHGDNNTWEILSK